MLSPSQVRELLFRESFDRTVWHAAVTFFVNRHHDRSPLTADDVWELVDRFGERETARLVHLVSFLAPSRKTESRLMTLARQLPGERGWHRLKFYNAIFHQPLDVITRQATDEERSSRLPDVAGRESRI